MSKLIGIMGLQGSGKDTVAHKIIYADNGNNWKKIAFADSLKDAIAALFGWNRPLLEGDSPESREWREKVDSYWSRELGIEDFTPRMALQMIGTEVIRNHFNENFWVKAVKRKILNTTSHIIITDVRFKNEAELIKSMGGKIIHVIRGGLPEWWDEAIEFNTKKKKIEDCELLKGIHPSNYSLAGIVEPDYVIQNDGTLIDLQREVLVMMDKLY